MRAAVIRTPGSPPDAADHPAPTSGPGRSLVDVTAAAIRAQAHDFVTTLPNGYNTVLGERGLTLSGGQRQRLAIARAMLKNAPILLLDEATASLDAENEALVQRGLEELMQTRTTIVMQTHCEKVGGVVLGGVSEEEAL